MGEWITPAEMKYTASDEWIKLESAEALVGITDYAQDQLSDLVFVELPEVGDQFDKEDVFGVVESVKAAADVKMPAGGEVIAINTALEDTPEMVNEDPYEKGWLIRIKVSALADLGDLMDADAYAAYCADR
nr:glycine cleavage system protein GcvH [Anaerolineae bacterium]